MWQGSGIWECSNESPPKRYHAATICDGGQDFPKEAAIAKHFASETAVRVCEGAIQIHREHRVIELLRVERYLSDARILYSRRHLRGPALNPRKGTVQRSGRLPR